ncbi:DUF2808 domain-containing protein [Leptolyngbya sp. FACHB-36]|uniref:DUF2808 domain-containing protein n=1 Tax=Leptolyngbya sp. FACHB-36 TaxID=2692808 RepID=UPI0016810270|nr:DUF2808 domain-containing protein [Leptolyngbya sp. FACHB-36]MBD2020552.1 DUF2808 domain-containing protein [Leptolyngbya sp. FACHB-36]
MQLIHPALVSIAFSTLLNAWMPAANPVENLPNSSDRAANVEITSASDSTSSKQNRLTATNNTYYFTVTLPERAGRGFTRLSFSEQTDAAPVWFDLPNVRAFVGTPNATGRTINSDAWIDETGTIWVEFKPSVPAKTTVTVALKTRKPPTASFYDYGIAAYPEKGAAVYVGNGTLKVQ